MSLENISPSLINLIRLSSALNSKDVNFFKQIDPSIHKDLDNLEEHFAEVINEILKTINTDNDSAAELSSDDGTSWKLVADQLDSIFEKTEIALDEFKFHETDDFTYLDNNPTAKPNKSIVKVKPQLSFIAKVNNFETESYKPNLTEKPNALRSLEESSQIIPEDPESPDHYPNPYSYEIMNQPFPEWTLQPLPEYKSASWSSSEDAQPMFITTLTQLNDLIDDLKSCKIIAVDLEHHDFRTYHGLTSLMQITSDKKVDYIIDTLAPEVRENLKSLNVIFTDPHIIKVLHGAFMDIIWLQRDFGLYIVSLFDTYHASKELMLGKYSLAFLLEKYVKFKTCKKYQLADWRIRPLSLDLVNYAKSDTHFLIEVFHKLQSELLKKGQDSLTRVLYQSRKVANRRYEYSTFKPYNNTNEVVSTNSSVPLNDSKELSVSFNYNKDQPWSNLIISSNIPLTQRPLLELLFKWRDIQAREQDESLRYIMNDYLLISIVTRMSLNSKVDHQMLLNIINDNSKFNSSNSFIRSKIDDLATFLNDGLSNLQKMDVSKWNKALGVENAVSDDEAKLGENINDLYQSIDDIEELERNFTGLAQEYIISHDLEDSSVETKRSNSKIWCIEYRKNGTPVKVTLDKIHERLNTLLENFREEELIELDETPVDEAAIEQESTPVEPKAVAIEERVKADPNEIVSLRKHQKHGKKRKLELDEDVIKLDLNKKILKSEPKNNRKDKKSKPKPKFDPYTNMDGDTIKAPKKANKLHSGKQAVYRKK